MNSVKIETDETKQAPLFLKDGTLCKQPLVRTCRTENAKMESCQSKDDKCGGKVEQIFSSEKEQREPWVDFAY